MLAPESIEIAAADAVPTCGWKAEPTLAGNLTRLVGTMPDGTEHGRFVLPNHDEQDVQRAARMALVAWMVLR